MANNIIDLTGKRFGRLVVIERTESENLKTPRWLCKCDCGAYKTVLGRHLRSGNTNSCGCLRREVVGVRSVEIARKVGSQNKTHGMHGTRLYNIWRGAKDRCQNENSKYYPRYGGRGITVCPEWSESFEAFRDWALANGYRDDLTLDREDNDGPYSPDNCRWATRTEQANNRRSNRYITFNGETKTVSQWAEIVGINKNTIYERLKSGWTVDDALTTHPSFDNRK